MSATSAQGAAPQMSFTLPPLPYSFDALEPYIDAKTMEIHHDKHHAAYVTNLNAALEGTEFADAPIEQLLDGLVNGRHIANVVRRIGIEQALQQARTERAGFGAALFRVHRLAGHDRAP